jgi:hypothetical protein
MLRFLVGLAFLAAGCAAPLPSPTASPPPAPSAAASETATPIVVPATSRPSPSSSAPPAMWGDGIPAAAGFERHAVSPDVRLLGILATDDGLVAYGAGPATADHPMGAPSVWTEDAGGGWSVAILPSDRRAGDALPAVGLGAGGTVILAGRGESSACAHPDLGTSWSSVDGGSWTQAPAQPGDCWRQPEGFALAPGGDGFLELTAATGEVYSVWRSADGAAWQELPSARALGRTNQLFSIATLGGTTVVVGREGGATSTAWASADATSWSATTLAAGDGVDATQVFAAGGRLLVPITRGEALVGLLAWDGHAPGWAAIALPDGATTIGAAASAGSTAVLVGTAGTLPAAWISSDGSAWRRIDLDVAPGGAQNVAIAGNRITVLGWLDDASGDQVPVAWIGAWPIP